jgi:hypothetical protein
MTVDPQLVDCQRRRKRIGQLQKPATRSQEVEAGFDYGLLRLDREPLDREARNDGAKTLDPTVEIFADSRRVTFYQGYPGELAAQHGNEPWFTLESDDAGRRTTRPYEAASQAPGSSAKLQHGPWLIEFDLASHGVGKTRATRISGCYPQRFLQPEAEENGCISDHVTGFSHQTTTKSITCMLQFFGRYIWIYAKSSSARGTGPGSGKRNALRWPSKLPTFARKRMFSAQPWPAL